MPIPGQPPPSPELRLALRLFAEHRTTEAGDVVTAAARAAKADAGSGSHPLALAYADLARFHYHAGDFKKAAGEFKHACDNPLPADPAGRRDRLAFMFGVAASLDALGRPADAEKVYRRCVAFARSLHGPAAPGTAAAIEPLAAFLLRVGNYAEAAALAGEACDIFRAHGDPAVAAVTPTRAEATRRAVLAHLGRDGPAELVARLEVAFEDGGTVHLVPHLARDPDPAEAARLESLLTRAVDELYARKPDPSPDP